MLARVPKVGLPTDVQLLELHDKWLSYSNTSNAALSFHNSHHVPLLAIQKKTKKKHIRLIGVLILQPDPVLRSTHSRPRRKNTRPFWTRSEAAPVWMQPAMLTA